MISGIWIAATAKAGMACVTAAPYPCFCWMDPRSCGTRWCACWGRPDAWTWPGCCAPTFSTQAYQAAELRAALRKQQPPYRVAA